MRTKPLELINASVACGEAWLRLNALIEAGDYVGIQAAEKACEWITEHYDNIYHQWQMVGGTSDIRSIALFDFTPRPSDMPLDFDIDSKPEIPF